MVDKPSCMNTTMPLVKSGGGDMALDSSWLWQKLVAPADDSFNIIAKPEWGMPVMTCQQTSGFGTAMPMTGGIALSDMRMAAIRNWICAGAAAP